MDFQAIWESDSDTRGQLGGALITAVQRDYYKFIDRANEEFAERLGKPVLMIPFGDIVCELDKRLKAGKIPGLPEL